MSSPSADELFSRKLQSCSKQRNSRIILALDINHRSNTVDLLADSKKLVREVSDLICAVKINFHLLMPLSISEITSLNDLIRDCGLVSIADIKLNDIDNTNLVATEYLWESDSREP